MIVCPCKMMIIVMFVYVHVPHVRGQTAACDTAASFIIIGSI